MCLGMRRLESSTCFGSTRAVRYVACERILKIMTHYSLPFEHTCPWEQWASSRLSQRNRSSHTSCTREKWTVLLKPAPGHWLRLIERLVCSTLMVSSTPIGRAGRDVATNCFPYQIHCYVRAHPSASMHRRKDEKHIPRVV